MKKVLVIIGTIVALVIISILIVTNPSLNLVDKIKEGVANNPFTNDTPNFPTDNLNANGNSDSSNNFVEGVETAGRGAYLTTEIPSGATACENFTDCTPNDEPACSYIDPEKLKCTEGPCIIRYKNKCEACLDDRVLYFVLGDCPFHD